MDDDTWIEQGQKINRTNELREYISELRTVVHHMQTGLDRAVFGAFTGRSWLDTPGAERSTDVLGEFLEMSVTPGGMPARLAVYRQSLASLVAALDTVDRAALGAWIADINATDPDRRA